MKLSLPARAALAVIRGYQRTLSPLFGRRCRFHPTCSAYAVEVIRTRGFARGILKAAWRILRCNPLNRGGYDPVRADGDAGEAEE